MITLAPIVLELTPSGYLVLPREIAQAWFPHDVLAAIVRDDVLWLYPMRGPAGGGLLLKQRNRDGDRCVLLTEILQGARWHGAFGACALHATWDDASGALRVPLRNA